VRSDSIDELPSDIERAWREFEPLLAGRWKRELIEKLSSTSDNSEKSRSNSDWIDPEAPASREEWMRARLAFQASIERRFNDCEAVVRNAVIETIVRFAKPRPELAAAALETSRGKFIEFAAEMKDSCIDEWLEINAWMRSGRSYTHLPTMDQERTELDGIAQIAERWTASKLWIDVGNAWHAQDSVRAASASASAAHRSLWIAGTAAVIAFGSLAFTVYSQLKPSAQHNEVTVKMIGPPTTEGGATDPLKSAPAASTEAMPTKHEPDSRSQPVGKHQSSGDISTPGHR